MKKLVVTITVLRYPVRYWYRAFADMGRWIMRPFRADGLRFQKMLGIGKNFGLLPDLSTYVFLAVWESPAHAEQFFGTATWQKRLLGADQTGTLWLEPFRSHGAWDGQNPFTEPPSSSDMPEPHTHDRPVAVLTRATIRTGALVDFWQHVPQARQRIQEHQDALVFAVGAGEKPLVQQCTISVWRNARFMEQFAYRQNGHKEIVRLTRQRRWYAEELFARFTVQRAEGALFAKLIDVPEKQPVVPLE